MASSGPAAAGGVERGSRDHQELPLLLRSGGEEDVEPIRGALVGDGGQLGSRGEAGLRRGQQSRGADQKKAAHASPPQGVAQPAQQGGVQDLMEHQRGVAPNAVGVVRQKNHGGTVSHGGNPLSDGYQMQNAWRKPRSGSGICLFAAYIIADFFRFVHRFLQIDPKKSPAQCQAGAGRRIAALHSEEDVGVAEGRVGDVVVDGVGVLFQVAADGLREILILEGGDDR